MWDDKYIQSSSHMIPGASQVRPDATMWYGTGEYDATMLRSATQRLDFVKCGGKDDLIMLRQVKLLCCTDGVGSASYFEFGKGHHSFGDA